jgi:ribosomal protein S12 methylthiotransferase
VPDILKEAENMIKNGIQEIILIAQDTTRYGYDRFGKSVLLTLLKKLDKIPGDFRYRLLYLYPDIMTTSHIKEMKKLKKFIPYFDIPLQHISSSVLKKMGRFGDEVSIKKFIDQIKDSFPVRFIRTNLIIGFPGETKQDFEKLVKFVEETKFDNIALFEYHDEPLAASSKLPNKVDNHEIRKRFTKMRQLVNKQLLENEHARK